MKAITYNINNINRTIWEEHYDIIYKLIYIYIYIYIYI